MGKMVAKTGTRFLNPDQFSGAYCDIPKAHKDGPRFFSIIITVFAKCSSEMDIIQHKIIIKGMEVECQIYPIDILLTTGG